MMYMKDNDYGVFGEVLEAYMIGSWKIELDEGKEPRMYADVTMRHLLGVDKDAELTPEEVYHAWYDHVDPAHYDAVAEGVEYMLKGEQAEIQYPWHHPDGRVIIVRCGGVRDKKYTVGARVAGIHQWVTYMKHVDRKQEEERQQLNDTLNALEIANKHGQFRADVLNYVMHNEDLDGFIEFSSNRILEIFSAERLIYRDSEGRQIVKERPGTPQIDFSLCRNCPYYKFDSAVYANGFTVMDDWSNGCKGFPHNPECPISASLAWQVYEGDKVFGYIALHYLNGPHHFTDDEKNTFDRLTKLISLVLTRRKHRKEIEESYAFANYFLDSFSSAYYVNLETHAFKVYKRSLGLQMPELESAVDAGNYLQALEHRINKSVHPDDRAALLEFAQPQNLKQLLKEKTVVNFTFRDISSAEEKIFCLSVVRGVDENNVAFAFADLTDETNKEYEQQKKLESALVASEKAIRRNEVLQRSIKSGPWTFTFNSKREIVKAQISQECYDVIQNDVNDNMGWLTLAHPDDHERVVQAFKQTLHDLTGNSPYDVEYRTLTRSGNYIWIRSAGRILRNPDGSGELYGICIDITDIVTRRNEEQRLQYLKTFGAMINAAAWSMDITDEETLTRVEWSDEFRHMLGFADERAFPNTLESWTNLLSAEDKGRVMEHYWTSVRSRTEGMVYDIHYRLKRKDGEYHWYHACGRMEKKSDTVRRLYGIIADITAEKELEESHRQLKEALAMAQSANRAKTTFLNNMSHDIRTPMNAIIGFTGLAASHIDSKELLQDYLTKIGQASNHLLSLINDVLDMSRIESGKMNLNEKPENLSNLIHILRDMVQVDIHNKQHDFFIDTVNVNDENIICDKLRLNQVLLNILSNAIKYTGQGGIISMRISETTVKSNGYATYEFCVKDNGMGMDQAFLKTLFDPFTRVKSSTVSGIQGTGLGMAIAKNIIDMMGGKIDVQSELGKGTQMTVTFDFKLQNEHRESLAIRELNGFRALVADDDANTCASVYSMLKGIGLRPEWCTSGKEAVFRAAMAYREGDLFKIYIIDWLMADMNGIETTRRIRKVIGDDAPIIILTAYDWSDIEEEAREAGVTAFVSKPMFPSDLQRVLNNCLGHQDIVEDRKEDPWDFSGKKILLVEDNELNREIACELLSEYGFTVDTAEDGTIAVDKMKNAAEGDYDLILMDIQMPIMNGYEATRQIRALKRPVSRIPILAMTADAFEEDRQKALDVGMNEHITKPINIAILKHTLAKFLL